MDVDVLSAHSCLTSLRYYHGSNYGTELGLPAFYFQLQFCPSLVVPVSPSPL